MNFAFISKFLLLSSIVIGYSDAQINRYITPCDTRDPQFNKCLQRLINNLKPYFPNGLTDINLSPIEPFYIKRIAINNNNGNLAIRGNFDDMTIRGLSNLHVTDVKSDVNKLRVDVKVVIPKLEIKGLYSILGNVILLPIQAKGNFYVEVEKVTAILKFSMHRAEINGEYYLQVDKLLLDYALKDVKFKIKDQLAPNLENLYNQFLNENGQLLIAELKKPIANGIADVLKGLFTNILSSAPEYFFIKL